MFKFLKQVREHEKHGNVAFLILSLEPGAIGTRVDHSTARTGILLGADGYLIMPEFDPGQLIEHIEKLQPRVPRLQQSATAKEKSEVK